MVADLKSDFAVTKFLPPKPWRPLVLRQQLRAGLIDGWRRKLILACAPAGFGKTTFLAQYCAWLQEQGMRACWLSLEPRDRDPSRLLLGIVRSIQAVHADLAHSLSGLIDIRPGTEADRLVDALVNDIATCGREVLLILDDYHEIDNGPVSDVMSRLLAFAPGNLHISIASRHVPSLNLSSLRLQGDIIEIGAAELRFSAAETREFLCEVRGHELTEAQIRLLHGQTEGWIAALQLTSLSFEKSGTGVMHALSGSHREIADYLTADLFSQLAPDMQDFLLASSVLDQMTPDLCDQVTGRNNSARLLREIERANLFLIALDEHGRWYRYHHLFRSFLRNQLAGQDPARARVLCRRASDWFSAREISEEAIDYARKSGDTAHMAELLETFAAEHVRHGRIIRLISWIQELPQSVIGHRPWLSLYLAYALFHLRRHEDVETVLAQGTAAMARGREDGTPYAEAEHADFAAKAEAVRLGLAGSAGSEPDLIARTIHLIDTHPELEPTYFCTLLNVLGYLQIGGGDYDGATATLLRARAWNERQDFVYGIVYADCFLGLNEAAQGHLGRAFELYVRAETLAAAKSGPHSLGHDFARLLRGIVLFEQNRIDEARPLIMASAQIACDFGPMEVHVLSHVILARLAAADGNLATAIAALDRAAPATQSALHLAARLALEERRIRLLLDQDRLPEALSTAALMEGDRDDPPPETWSETARLRAAIRCRLDIARGEAAAAAQRAMAFQASAAQSGRRQRQLEFLALEIRAHLAAHDRGRAQERLLDSFRLVYPENYVRIFVEEVPELASLIRDLLRSNPDARTWVPEGLKAATADGRPQKSSPKTAPAEAYFLIEPLSDREREVLAHLAIGKSNQQIAADMSVAINTVKWHVQNIFSKLGVSNRTAATLAAQQLNLT